uniref:Sugar ABC transporter permease n=1 Tax=Pseudothermotoga hypogea TaxID=57487 RepID=A0A832I716_9THEM
MSRFLGGVSKKKQISWFLIFSSLSLILLVVTFYIPILYAIWFAFTDYDAISQPHFVGLSNFQKAFSDKVFWISFRNTLAYTLMVVPLVTAFSFLIALALKENSVFSRIMRIFYILPLVTSSVAIAFVWRWIYNPSYGILNAILGLFGVQPIRWLVSPNTALISLAILGIWGSTSYYILIYLAGLQNIPEELYEAARIDGASGWQQLIHITVPLISPTTFFVVVTGFIGAFQVFDPVFLLTNGGPGYSTYTVTFYIYQNGFVWFKMGYGMAISWILLGLVMIITVVQFIAQKRWVHYYA